MAVETLNYAAAVSSADVFIGMGMLALLAVVSYMAYQWARSFRYEADGHEYLAAFKIASMKNIATKKKIDLEKEVKMRRIKTPKSFESMLKKEMIEDMFGKQKE